LGSIFRNPEGDHAGRLIEAAGLKGRRIGKVEISQKHANFFISQDSASASDYAALITLAQEKVLDKFGVSLDLEIEKIGDWSGTG
jgi:UDP-N-acetylmuramate dehydrogenase